MLRKKEMSLCDESLTVLLAFVFGEWWMVELSGDYELD
jgi:hypothetical protein